MNILRQYWSVFAVLFIVLVAVLFRTFNPGSFKYDARKLAEPSVMRSNIITEDQVSELKSKKLINDIGTSGNVNEKFRDFIIKISPDSILEKNNLKIIRKQKGPIILAASENSVSARIWMLLSQMGLKNIFILSAESDPEELKSKFRPDTLSGPEL